MRHSADIFDAARRGSGPTFLDTLTDEQAKDLAAHFEGELPVEGAVDTALTEEEMESIQGPYLTDFERGRRDNGDPTGHWSDLERRELAGVYDEEAEHSYLVVVGGDDVVPTYDLKSRKDDAFRLAKSWMEGEEDGDWADVLQIGSGTIRRIEE